MSLYDEAEKSRQKRLMEETAKQYGTAIGLIAQVLWEHRHTTANLPEERDKQLAALILARLSSHNPPILLAYADEIKD